MKKIKITNQVSHPVTLMVPAINFKRELMAKGASIEVNQDIFEEIMYYQGFVNLVKQGILSYEGLPEELKDQVDFPESKSYTKKDYEDFINLRDKEEINKIIDNMPVAQVREFANFLVGQDMFSSHFNDAIKRKVGLNVKMMQELRKEK